MCTFLRKIFKDSLYSALGAPVPDDFFETVRKGETVVYDSGKTWVTFRTPSLSRTDTLFWKNNVLRLSRGRLIITKRGILAVVGGYKMIDLPFSDTRFKALEFHREVARRFTIAFESSKTSKTLKGQVSFSFWVNPEKVPNF